MMNALELFSGTGSVRKVCEAKGYNVTSLDINNRTNADIICDIRNWNYREYAPGHFDLVWASPDCTQYSKAKTKGARDIEGANELVLKTLEIIRYLAPRTWIIENPQTGLLKNQPFMSNLPYYDGDYCMYHYPYRKRTRFWTNQVGLQLKLCDKQCGSYKDGRHVGSCGSGSSMSKKYIQFNIRHKYSIPPALLDILIPNLT